MTRVSTNKCTMAACSGSSSSTSESSSTASCRLSTSSASGADDDTIPTDTTASSTDSEALSLLEKLRAPREEKTRMQGSLGEKYVLRRMIRRFTRRVRHSLCHNEFIGSKLQQFFFAYWGAL